METTVLSRGMFIKASKVFPSFLDLVVLISGFNRKQKRNRAKREYELILKIERQQRNHRKAFSDDILLLIYVRISRNVE